MKHPQWGRSTRRVLSLTAPTGGVDVSSPPHGIRDDRLSDATNVWQKNGVLCTRPALRENSRVDEAAGMSFTTAVIGDRVFLHGKAGTRHYLGTIIGGSLSGRTHTLDGVRAITAVPDGRDATADNERDAVLFLDSQNAAVRGVYGMSSDGAITKLEPYVPTLRMAARPTLLSVREDSGAYLEPFNRLTDAFRCTYTADDEGLYYWLPEGVLLDMSRPLTVTVTGFAGVTITHTVNTKKNGIWKEIFDTTEDMPLDQLSLHVDPARGCFWFAHATDVSIMAPAPATESENVVIDAYRQATGAADTVYGMRFGTWFGAGYDGVRLFLSGNAKEPNLVVWSALGNPLYFPEHNHAYVGDASGAVTAFGKQNEWLVIFKSHELYAARAGGASAVTAEELTAGAVTDTEAAAAVFPIEQWHPERGCDLPATLCLCGDRLVWTCCDGRVYALYTGGSNDVRCVRAISAPIEADLAQYPAAARRYATAACHDGKYLLSMGGIVYVMDGASKGFAYYTGYGSDSAAQQAIAWYIWKQPLVETKLTGAKGSACFVTALSDALVTHTLCDAECDYVGSVAHPIETQLCTKWYTLGAPEEYKHIAALRLWMTGDADVPVTVSLCGGTKRLTAALRMNGAPIEEAPPRRLAVGASRVRYGGVEITARAGDFAIFFPDDAHKPCICVSEPSEVKKIVMKVRV